MGRISTAKTQRAFEPILTHAAGIWWHTGPENTGNTPKSIPNLAANGAFIRDPNYPFVGSKWGLYKGP